MANRNFANSRVYTGHVMPVWLDCNFTVNSSDTGGLGITGLKGPYIQNIFMHTSATPGVGNSNPSSLNIPVTNPNPAAGTIIIQLQDNYNRLYTTGMSAISPLSGTPVAITAVVAGTAYTIVSVGTTTAASWHTAGVPSGITPAAGVSFIASATPGVGTGSVQASAAAGSGIATAESVSDPNLTLAPDPTVSQGFGAQIIVQCRDYAGAIAAPANGTVMSLSLLLSNSSVLIGGE